MRYRLLLPACLLLAGTLQGAEPVETARPVPPVRPEMKQLLEDMKARPLRIPLPELTAAEREELGDRANSYETRLRFHYMPPRAESVFGSRSRRSSQASSTTRDFTRNADENMTLTYEFKTMLFWIASRANNCQYCLGHQEQKLSAAGLTESQIAALDADWSRYTPADQAAFAYARKLTYEPHRLNDDDITELEAHFTPRQILEMTMSVAGNNAINRWKEGTGVPQSQSGENFFRRFGGDIPTDRPLPIESFLTPTPAEFQSSVSIVAPLELDSAGRPTGRGISTRPPLESRSEVEAKLAAAKTRTPRLPLLSKEQTRNAFDDLSLAGNVPNWLRLMANFPNESRRRIGSINEIDSIEGDLTPLLKAQVSWMIARQDRAWYAAGLAKEKLKQLEQTEDQIFALDGAWADFSPADRSLFRFARNLAAAPIALTDDDVATALERTSPRHVVQLINFVTSRAYFDRVTEAAGLPLDH
jgi:alkylhydroperoxidase family enzyme